LKCRFWQEKCHYQKNKKMNVHLLGKQIFPELGNDNGVASESGDGNAGNQAFMIEKTLDTTCYSDRMG